MWHEFIPASYEVRQNLLPGLFILQRVPFEFLDPFYFCVPTAVRKLGISNDSYLSKHENRPFENLSILLPETLEIIYAFCM